MSFQNVFCMSTSFPSLTIQVLIGLVLLACLSLIHCEEECLRSRIRCYECESTKNPGCNDPFNVTAMEMDYLKTCHGCCVKVVRERNTPNQNIWRTCTNRLQINLFMVDHVCMEESGGQGHMCFCESDSCNGAVSLIHFRRLPLLSTTTNAAQWLLQWLLGSKNNPLAHIPPLLATLVTLPTSLLLIILLRIAFI